MTKSSVPDTQGDSQYDLIIIGAGPAGMAAASTAAREGLTVALMDEQCSVGGQIYRAIQHTALQDQQILGADYYAGQTLLTAFEQQLNAEQSQITYFPNSMVWSVEDDLIVSFSSGEISHRLRAKKVLLATGAMERPVAFPGWTLPGVMTCGAAQILLKQSALAPAAPLVLAGSGPLLLLIAAQLNRAGVAITAVLDTTPKGRYLKAAKYLWGALKNPGLLKKGLGLLQELKKSGIRYERQVSDLKAIACEQGIQLEQVQFSVSGKVQQIDCNSLLVHQGVVPNVQLSRALGLAHQWQALQQCWSPVRDTWGQSSHADIFIAGDGGGIAGAVAAECQGQLAALKIAEQLERINPQVLVQQTRPIQRILAKQLSIRPFLDQLYQPAEAFLKPLGDTIVCRCEEISADQIRKIAAQGVAGPNQAKAFCRAGMGPCQGRMCGLTVANLIADEQNRTVEAVGYYQIRSPIKPLTLSELADLAD